MSRKPPKEAPPAAQFSSKDFDSDGAGDDQQGPPPSVPQLGATAVDEPTEVIIEAWCGPVPPRAYNPIHVEAQLTSREGEALKRLAVGLNQKNCRLDDGTHVKSQPTALRWLLQRLADQVLGERFGNPEQSGAIRTSDND